MTIDIRQATVADLDALVPLFDGYRQFYRHPSEPHRIRRFLLERFEQGQSVILIAVRGGEAIGFTQLYPGFSTGALRRTFVLNDLFVAPGARRAGVGAALLSAAAAYARSVGALRLTLVTESTNAEARALYEKSGWRRDGAFLTYHLVV